MDRRPLVVQRAVVMRVWDIANVLGLKTQAESHPKPELKDGAAIPLLSDRHCGDCVLRLMAGT